MHLFVAWVELGLDRTTVADLINLVLIFVRPLGITTPKWVD